jgi:hypothetical protein
VNPTHEEVLAAIDKARTRPHPCWESECGGAASGERNSHCDDLRATAELAEWVDCECDLGDDCDRRIIAARLRQQVIDRLTAWGVL